MTARPTRTPITRTRALVGLLTLSVAVGALAGCDLFADERVCLEGEHPVLTVDEHGALTGGSSCVREGEPVPPGNVRYPRDLEPTYLRDQEAATRAFQERLDRSGRGTATPR